MVGPFKSKLTILWSMGYFTSIRSFSASRNLFSGWTSVFAVAKVPGLSSTPRSRTRADQLVPFSSKVSISDAYDAGRIDLVGIRDRKDEKGDAVASKVVSLRIKPDPYTELEEKSHFQYFAHENKKIKIRRTTLLLSKLINVKLKFKKIYIFDENSLTSVGN